MDFLYLFLKQYKSVNKIQYKKMKLLLIINYFLRKIPKPKLFTSIEKIINKN